MEIKIEKIDAYVHEVTIEHGEIERIQILNLGRLGIGDRVDLALKLREAAEQLMTGLDNLE